MRSYRFVAEVTFKFKFLKYLKSMILHFFYDAFVSDLEKKYQPQNRSVLIITITRLSRKNNAEGLSKVESLANLR